MSTYTPDVWTVVEISYDGETIRKVLAGWYGGYLNGDSWKLSSGITNIRDLDDRYEFDNISGSVYVCHKGAKKMSGMTASIYHSFEKELEGVEGSYIKEVENVLS